MFFVLVVSVRVSSEYVSIGLTAVLYFEVVYISILTQGTSYTKLLPLLSVKSVASNNRVDYNRNGFE